MRVIEIYTCVYNRIISYLVGRHMSDNKNTLCIRCERNKGAVYSKQYYYVSVSGLETGLA